jgi:hypothetical protein
LPHGKVVSPAAEVRGVRFSEVLHGKQAWLSSSKSFNQIFIMPPGRNLILLRWQYENDRGSIDLRVVFSICFMGAESCRQTTFFNTPHAQQKVSGLKFAEVSEEVRQFFATPMKGESPYLISGDFDGNEQPDYAVLIWHGNVRNDEGKAIAPRSFLVVFLRKGRRYRTYVIKDPNGEYLGLAKKGSRGFNYDEQTNMTYSNDAIVTGILDKGGSSYVYENGRFRTFVSSD